METDKHYFRVGLFVLLTVALGAAFALWLVGAYNQNQYALYRIRFPESVSGLAIGGPVKFRGVQVGKIDSMSIDPQDSNLVRVDADILKTAPIQGNTVASLKLQGITGGIYIELSNDDSKPAADAPTGDKNNPPEIPAEPSTISTLIEKTSHIVDQMDKLFSDKNIDSINHTIGNAKKISDNASALSGQLKEHPSELIWGAPKKDKDQEKSK